MFAWIAHNAAAIIAIAVILIAVAIAVISIVKDKKRGSGVCTGNCATCGMSCCNRKE